MMSGDICGGSPSLERLEVGVVIASPEGVITKHSLCHEFLVTNNESMYEALRA